MSPSVPAVRLSILTAAFAWGCGDERPLPDDPSAPRPATQARSSSQAAPKAAPALPPTTAEAQLPAPLESAPPTATVRPARSTKEPPAVAPTASAPTPKSFDQTCSPAEADLKALGLPRFVVTHEVADRQPGEPIETTRVGQEVWAYLEVENRGDPERCVGVVFTIAGKRRAALTLDIGTSPRWRTWARITVGEADRGKRIEVTVEDDQGHRLGRKTVKVER